jgi:hypothetical protein
MWQNQLCHSTTFRLAFLIVAASLSWSDDVAAATVHGFIHEDGKAVAARLYIESAAGKFYHAKAADSSGPQAVTYRVDRGKDSNEIHTSLPAGKFEANLPPGTYTFTVRRGKEYREVSQQVAVPKESAQVGPIEIKIERWIHMAAQGWYSGDTHVHRSVDETSRALLAEDLNIAFPLTYWVTDSEQTPVQAAKSVKQSPGNKPLEIAPNHLVYPLNTEYELFTYGGKRHTLGAVFVIGHQTPLELTAPPIKPIAEAARQQNALLDLDKHTWPWSPMIVPIMKIDLFELANNHIWRTGFLFRQWTIDTLPSDWDIETDETGGWTEHGWIDFGFKTYYAFLNCGFDIKPTGGTATGVHPVPLGFGRVYVQVDGDFTYEKWFTGLGAGRSFVTTGPMLTVEFDKMPHGSKIDLHSTGATECRVQGLAVADGPLSRVEILVNGDVIETIRPRDSSASAASRIEIDHTFLINESSWVAVRCFQPREGKRYFYAHTAPTFYNSSKPLSPKRKEVLYLLRRVQEEITRNQGVLTEQQLAEFHEAEAIYQGLLKKAR